MPQDATEEGAEIAALPARTVWRLRCTTIFWFVLVLACVLALPAMFDATALLVIAAVPLALLVGAMLAVVARYFTRRRHGSFFGCWMKTSVACFCLICIIVAAPIFYFALKTALYPALLPKVTLSDGRKTVILQGMMHIGTERFYKSIVYDAEPR